MKKVVELIEKLAQDMPVPSQPKKHVSEQGSNMPKRVVEDIPRKGGPVSAPIPGTKPTTHSTGPWVSSAKSITGMQQAIFKLVDSIFSVKSKDPRIANEKQQFNSFLSNQYEATTQPGSNANLEDALNAVKKLDVRGSMTPGVWDAKMQAALQNIYYFASAFVKMSHDFGGIPHGLPFVFGNEDVKELGALSQIDPKKINRNDLLDAAHHATDLINKLNSFYNYYYQSIITHPNYRAYVAENKPLYTVKSDNSDPDSILTNTKNIDDLVLVNVVVPAKNDPNGRKQIPRLGISVMRDAATFKQFIKASLGYTDEDLAKDPSIMTRVLSAIKLNIQQNLPAKG
jgi:hypothetical protein